MSLSPAAKNRLNIALVSKTAGSELAAAIDLKNPVPATKIIALGTTTNLSPLVVAPTTIAASACAGGDTPSATDVDLAIDAATLAIASALDLKCDNADAETLRTQTESRLAAIEAKMDAMLGSMKAANRMASA